MSSSDPASREAAARRRRARLAAMQSELAVLTALYSLV
jgi:hypothetical protein